VRQCQGYGRLGNAEVTCWGYGCDGLHLDGEGKRESRLQYVLVKVPFIDKAREALRVA
jgi:hypothetical protein